MISRQYILEKIFGIKICNLSYSLTYVCNTRAFVASHCEDVSADVNPTQALFNSLWGEWRMLATRSRYIFWPVQEEDCLLWHCLAQQKECPQMLASGLCKGSKGMLSVGFIVILQHCAGKGCTSHPRAEYSGWMLWSHKDSKTATHTSVVIVTGWLKLWLSCRTSSEQKVYFCLVFMNYFLICKPHAVQGATCSWSCPCSRAQICK
jgi:hypothetical protein